MATPGDPIIGVGAVVVRDGALLMVKRGRDPGAGLWSIPGGRLEHGEYIVDAIKREVREETGLDVEVGDLLGILELPGETHFVILDHRAVVTGDASPVAADDAAEVRWVPLDQIDSLECTPHLADSMRAWGVLD